MNNKRTMRVGVLGAGQLALMLAEAGHKLGVEVVCAGKPGDCAGSVAPIVAVDLEDTAQVLGISESTVKRDWNTARVWLYRELDRTASA